MQIQWLTCASLNASSESGKESVLSLSRRWMLLDQPQHFINLLWAFKTDGHSVEDSELLRELQAIERAHRRVRGERWGPRTLDLDLLLYGQSSIETPDLRVPHPGLHERSFVLYPLSDIDPDLEIPGNERLSALIARCPSDDLQPLD